MLYFEEDISPVKILHPHILPNYPPGSWKREPREYSEPLKAIYIGAFSSASMFSKEFGHWVNSQDGKVIWDVYSHFYTNEDIDYFSEKGPYIKLNKGVDYATLPALLEKYDVGVILYKGNIPNFVHNIPNKLYEYLACGLDVWFSDTLKGSFSLLTTNTFPKVLALDFTHLESVKLSVLISREGLTYAQPDYYCENILPEIINEVV